MIGSKLLTGAMAGGIATAPMTLAMAAMHRWLPSHERYPLPPSEITARLTEEAGVAQHVDREQHTALTLANHFGYGAAVGAIYALLANRLRSAQGATLAGIGYGLLVWAVSYLGLLPALGILRPATEHPERRNALMIVAHVIWGSITGLLVQRMQRRRDRADRRGV